MTKSVPHVLVVDDVPQILEFFSNVAARMKVSLFDLTTIGDPRVAMNLLNEEKFDVVISDFRMPHVNGVQLLTRAHDTHPSGRRVLMTGYNELPVKRRELEAAAMDAYLQKPLAAQEIILLLWGLIAAEPIALEEYRKEARDLEAAALAGNDGPPPSL